ncbi:hypothetical protein [Modicisalibacter sp. MOD 31.J]|uniref:hypothetical protein n=1 Tax=Modicisalibacter sp. MOD 31.J TaxID=2831897 RepID=UPI001CCFD56C|nr:hypothetical protein [Modicisalibacter sp. MOD 31.J]MBZ9574700.1 hypothetical protein [Modicisalibacter sp. MOD 31.J]
MATLLFSGRLSGKYRHTSAGIEGKQRVAKKMTQEQIDETRRESQAWQEEHNVQVGGGFIRRVK